ncbi:MAG: hypothetical protein GEU99_25125 [Luteitalea sp.]|nr:hypothetical protein [Luteitalea sp.]
MSSLTRRRFLTRTLDGLAASLLVDEIGTIGAQVLGARPARAHDVSVLNPGARVPVGLIIDDSTCLVNLNRFAMPQFDEAFGGANEAYKKPWREWPVEIPDRFVRRFGEWCADQGVKGKYSIVPYPACVGRLDRGLPGWTQREVADSLELVRSLLLPNWDIHPEIVTHTRVIDLETGHPYADHSLRFMENWEWTTGRSADEIAQYMVYALQILKNVGLPCDGITTPGGFAVKALPELAEATLQAVRDVFRAEIPHYFRHAYAKGDESVAPRVELAGDLDGPDPRAVVSIVSCTGDWTGGWDNKPPAGADRFITEDLQSGRVVEVVERGEPAVMQAHWTGFYWNGQELGFKVFQEVVRRLHARFDDLVWMKLSEVARYWAAKELTRIDRVDRRVAFRAPFACPQFTVQIPGARGARPRFAAGGGPATALREVGTRLDLRSGTWWREQERLIVCFDLPKGASELRLGEDEDV